MSDTSITVDVHRSAAWAEVDAAAKRVLDVVVGAVGLLLLAPVLALLALLIRLDSPGPVFYRAARAGYRGRDLAMLKFRKMRDGAAGIPLTLAEDDRFTRLGRWLARRKIDELPQLWHLITGEMSLVGPRPEAAGFVALQREEYEQILAVRPGIFGWSQLAFAKEGQVLDTSDPVAHYVSTILPQKMSLDAMYARRRTLLIDLRIVFWSVRTVLAGTSVAVHRTDGAMRVRTRPDQAHPSGSAHRNAACVKESSRAAGPGPHVATQGARTALSRMVGVSMGLVLFFVAAGSASAGVLYVSPSGSETGACVSAEPCSPGRADAVVAPGDTVLVGPGGYGSLVLTRGGTGVAPVRWVSAARWGAHVANVRVAGSAPFVTVEGFDVGGAAGSLVVVDGSYGRVVGNHVHDSVSACAEAGAGIVIAGYQAGGYNGVGGEVLGNLVEDIGVGPRDGSCRSLHGISSLIPGVRIANNVQRRALAHGIHLWHAARDTVIVNNTVTENGASGILVGAGDAGATGVMPVVSGDVVANNIVAFNREWGISECCDSSPARGPNRYVANLGWRNGEGNGAPTLVDNVRGGGTVAGSLYGDPLFAGDDDAHLRAASPAIDAGTVVNAQRWISTAPRGRRATAWTWAPTRLRSLPAPGARRRARRAARAGSPAVASRRAGSGWRRRAPSAFASAALAARASGFASGASTVRSPPRRSGCAAAGRAR